ncbi:MAG: preprotein translocase subunit YajC [Hyphomicrobiales bacterium]|nr:preprotein translocase subunit YajC [Rickettsiales bacterium]MCP5362243.1 preprotein translocase subunit YajC [Hyphomicrobiales bacterium]
METIQVQPSGSANAPLPPEQPGLGGLIAPFILLIAIFYFLMYRPQKKRMDEHRSMLDSIQKGDAVVTSGGIIGKVVKIEDNKLELEVSPGVRVYAVKNMVNEKITDKALAKLPQAESAPKKATKKKAA